MEQKLKIKPLNKEQLMEYVNNHNFSLSILDVSEIEDMSGLFNGCTRTSYEGIEDWDVSKVEDMEAMFYESDFTKDLSKWNISDICDNDYIFKDCNISVYHLGTNK